MTGVLMAKPKAAPARKDVGPKPTKTVSVRATLEWAEWLEEGARFCRTDLAKLLDVAAVDYLKAKGFTKPAPERMP
jgi:hypothetical protein